MKEKKRGRRKKKQQQKDRNTKQNYKIQMYTLKKNNKTDERLPCQVIINDKHEIYFLFLKRFIDIRFVKTVQCISF